VFGLESAEVRHLSQADKRLDDVIQSIGEITYNVHTDGFSFVIETIIGQMLSVKAADAIKVRLYDVCDGEFSLATINRLTKSIIKSTGLSTNKTEYIKTFASVIKKDQNFLDRLRELDDISVIQNLTSIRGIGSWTAKMYLIFVLNRQDVLPFEDGAFLQAYKWLYSTDNTEKTAVIETCKPWCPYSSLAARYLYVALDSGLVTKTKTL